MTVARGGLLSDAHSHQSASDFSATAMLGETVYASVLGTSYAYIKLEPNR